MKTASIPFILIVLIVIGAIIYASFLFLADKETTITPKVRILKEQEKIISAKKERDARLIVSDSIDKEIKTFKPQKQVNREIDEKVNRIVSTATDVRLDSILTNYRFTPLSKEGNR